MPTFGRTLLGQVGLDLQLSADGKPEYKAGGVTIDWSTVAAVTTNPLVLPDGNTVQVGNSYLRYGQVVCAITNQPVQVITLGGSPTGGTWTANGVRPDNGQTVVTAPVAYNVSAANLLIALRAVFGTPNVASVSGSAGGPYTITFNSAQTTLGGNITGLTGGTPTFANSVSVAGLNYGKYGPFDPAASDGRQVLTAGQCFLLNMSVYQNMLFGVGATDSDNPAAIEGGNVWFDRIIQSGVATHTLAAGPTFAELQAAFPNLRYTRN